MRAVDISAPGSKEVEFSYSVRWQETSITFDHRMDRYARYSFLKQHLEVRLLLGGGARRGRRGRAEVLHAAAAWAAVCVCVCLCACV